MDKKARRDALRAATVGSKANKLSERVKVGDLEIEVRQLSYGDKDRILGQAEGENGKFAPNRYAMLALINSVYDPEVGDRVLEDGDLDELLGRADEPWLTALMAALDRVSGPKGDKGRPTTSTTENTPSAS